MERLLEVGLTWFIRRGNLRVAVAVENAQTFGDGTGTGVDSLQKPPRGQSLDDAQLAK